MPTHALPCLMASLAVGLIFLSGLELAEAHADEGESLFAGLFGRHPSTTGHQARIQYPSFQSLALKLAENINVGKEELSPHTKHALYPKVVGTRPVFELVSGAAVAAPIPATPSVGLYQMDDRPPSFRMSGGDSQDGDIVDTPVVESVPFVEAAPLPSVYEHESIESDYHSPSEAGRGRESIVDAIAALKKVSNAADRNGEGSFLLVNRRASEDEDQAKKKKEWILLQEIVRLQSLLKHEEELKEQRSEWSKQQTIRNEEWALRQVAHARISDIQKEANARMAKAQAVAEKALAEQRLNAEATAIRSAIEHLRMHKALSAVKARSNSKQ
jgi:hypothetical protein